jgi:trk system potassium uptake protein TrkA
MKQFVQIGVGTFGYNVARELCRLGHQVLVIDSDDRRIEQIKADVTQAVVADVTNKQVLREFVTDAIDGVLVSLGDNLEATILAVFFLREQGVRNIIVKAANEDHARVLRVVGATRVIHPEREVAMSLAQKLTFPNLIEHIPLAPEYGIVEIACPDKFVDKSLRELQLRNKYNLEVIAIKEVLRNEFHFVPGADFRLPLDSALIIIGKKSDIEKLKF